MNGSKCAMEKYDIYWAYFKYEDSNEFKKRPVLIMEDGTILDIAKITKHNSRDKYDIALIDWKIEGLRVPSTLRLSKRLRVGKEALKSYIGHLSSKDIKRVEDRIDKLTITNLQEEKKKKSQFTMTSGDIPTNIKMFNTMMGNEGISGGAIAEEVEESNIKPHTTLRRLCRPR